MTEQRGPAILTVEDEILISGFLGDVLRDAGYEVVATSNANDAIAMLEDRDDIRLIITDVNMPGSVDGLRLAHAVRGRWPPVKIIAATGGTQPANDWMPPGGVFLSKPYDPDAVIAAIRRLLSRAWDAVLGPRADGPVGNRECGFVPRRLARKPN